MCKSFTRDFHFGFPVWSIQQSPELRTKLLAAHRRWPHQYPLIVGSRRQLHHPPTAAARFLDPVNVRDIRMIEGRQHLRFALESRQPFGILRQSGRKKTRLDAARISPPHLSTPREANSGKPRVWNWNGMERILGKGSLSVVENVVARDGIEPPTPAFSGLLTDCVKWFRISGSPWLTETCAKPPLALSGFI